MTALTQKLDEIIENMTKRLDAHYAWFDCEKSLSHFCELESHLKEHLALAKALKVAIGKCITVMKGTGFDEHWVTDFEKEILSIIEDGK